MPFGLQSLANAIVGRSCRGVTPQIDDQQMPPRCDRKGELYVENLWNNQSALAQEGSLYVAQTATPGTGIALTLTAGSSFSATQGIFGVNNLDQNPSLGGQGKDHIPLWLKIVITNAGANGTDDHFAVVVDKGARVSGGTATLAGHNVNPNYPLNDDTSAIFAGLPTIAAATANAFNCGRAEGRKAAAPAYIVGDTVTFVFGAPEQVQVQAITPTVAIGLVLQLPPVIVPPGWSWVLLEWMTARLTTAQAAEIEYGYCLR